MKRERRKTVPPSQREPRKPPMIIPEMIEPPPIEIELTETIEDILEDEPLDSAIDDRHAFNLGNGGRWRRPVRDMDE